MFWMRNKENNFPIRTFIWRPAEHGHLKEAQKLRIYDKYKIPRGGQYIHQRQVFLLMAWAKLSINVLHVSKVQFLASWIILNSPDHQIAAIKLK